MGVNDREGVAVACTDGGVGQERGAEQGSAPTVEKLLKVEPAQVRWSGGSFLCTCTCIYMYASCEQELRVTHTCEMCLLRCYLSALFSCHM